MSNDLRPCFHPRCGLLTDIQLRFCNWCGFDKVEFNYHEENPNQPLVEEHRIKVKEPYLSPVNIHWSEVKIRLLNGMTMEEAVLDIYKGQGGRQR